VSLSASAVKKSILKNQDGAAAISLTDPFRIITKYRDVSFFQNGGSPPCWIFEIELFNSRAVQRPVLRYRVKFLQRSVVQLKIYRNFSFFSSEL